MARNLADRDYVYLWADGLHFNVRLEEERLCCLVIVGVRLDGKKELIAIADGYRESTDSWAALLRDLRHRDMRAPVVAVGDGALGFWAALRDVGADRDLLAIAGTHRGHQLRRLLAPRPLELIRKILDRGPRLVFVACGIRLRLVRSEEHTSE